MIENPAAPTGTQTCEAAPESGPGPEAAAATPPAAASTGFYCQGWLVNLGWLNTTLALSVAALPFKFLLKDRLHLDAEELARFMLFANVPIYVKPLAGILVDAVPLFGTRRRHYVVFGLLLAALFWVLLGLVPRDFGSLLTTYLALNLFLTLVSTVLGGLMVEVGQREGRTGRLSAQRHGVTQLMGLVGGPIGGLLAKHAFLIPASVCALAYAGAAPVFWLKLKEPGGQTPDAGPLREVGRQTRSILRAGPLWAAAAMIVLVVAAPGFGTPLFYYQTDGLRFRPEFIALLGVVGAACAVAAAWLYSHFCRRIPLRLLLGGSIVLHASLTLLYLFYRTPVSALLIAGMEGATMSLALLPLYDLAARATPRSSEALGYCLILSVWNLTSMLSDFVGSWLYSRWHLTFGSLVWLNAGTTLLVLAVVPLLPAALMQRRDGDPPALVAAVSR